MTRKALTASQQRALAYLDGVELPDGRLAHLAPETGRWYRFGRRVLADLGARLDSRQEDAYSLWCGETPSEELSARVALRLGLGVQS